MRGQGIILKDLIRLFFSQKSEENEKYVYETPIIKITDEAYKKLNLYSKIVSEIVGKDIECGGRMLNYSNRNDGVIRDVYLDYQIARSDKVWYADDGSTYINYVRQSGMSLAGMWHSHGIYPPGHSRLDDKAIKWLHKHNKNSKECIIRNNQNPNRSKKIAQDSRMFYTPSIVINKDEYLNDGPGRKYYAEFIAGNGKDKDVKVKDVKLEIIEENNNVIPTLEEIVLEVGEKVKHKRILGKVKLKHLHRYNSVLERYKKLQINPPVQTYLKNSTKEHSISQYQKIILPKKVLDYINQGGKK